MNELGIEIETVLPWFVVVPDQQFTRVSVPPDQVATWSDLLGDAVRRCYISDQHLAERVNATQCAPTEILGAKLPDPGPVMSGDFGEIVAYIYLASRNQATVVSGPKKWRLKEDRNRPAPHSDVVQFVLPHWPDASGEDRLVCAEVKTKATTSSFRPIGSAIKDSRKDSTSRLARTLVWLRERALVEEIGEFTIPQIDRFINATEYPAYTRQFHAIAVICSTLVDNELATLLPAEIPAGCALVVISVPDLQNTYTMVYEAAHQSVVTPETLA